MRIIAGTLGGRQFASPPGHRTHPMSDKMRGGLFNALGDITGLTVLDAFAGSGALGLEALSRGASHVTAIDIDKKATDTQAKNASDLNLSSSYKSIRAAVSGWSDNNEYELFDIVFVDPPYDDLQTTSLDKIVRHVKKSGLLILSWPGGQQTYQFNNMRQVKVQNYGDSQLVFYRKKQ